MSLFEVDSRAQSEANHDLAAIGDDLGSITSDPAWQGALKKSLGDLKAARDAHKDAIHARSADTEETAQVLDEYRVNLENLLALYSGLRAAAQSFVSAYALQDLKADEAGKRRRVFERLFRHPISSLAREGRQSNRTFFEAFVTQISEGSETVKHLVEVLDRQIPNGIAELKTRVSKVAASLDRYQRERDEDQSATEAVDKARTELNHASQVHALVLSAVMTAEGRKHEISKFLLRRDPAYLSRFRPRDSEEEAVAMDETA